MAIVVALVRALLLLRPVEEALGGVERGVDQEERGRRVDLHVIQSELVEIVVRKKEGRTVREPHELSYASCSSWTCCVALRRAIRDASSS